MFRIIPSAQVCFIPDSRSKDIVEPLMKPQWYVSCTDMGKQAADAVREGHLKIIPDHHLKTWFNWMDNIRYMMSFSLCVFFILHYLYFKRSINIIELLIVF